GGSVTVRIEDIGEDTVRVIAAGRINNVTHNSMLEAKLSSIFPTVESALTVFGDSVEVTSDGKAFLIDGNDYNIDGSKGSAPAVEGIGVQSDKAVQDVKEQLENADGGSISDRVIGKSGVGSVGSFSSSNLSELHTFYKELATITMAAGKYSDNRVIGSLEQPEIVYVPGDLEWGGTITGAGILVVDGQLIMKGKIEWKGIILTMAGDVKIELGGSGTPNILGTVWVGNNTSAQVTNVHLSGNPGLRYSYQTLTTILSNLGLLEVEIIKYYE
ncbi:MAG: hypothetical protein KFH87_02760, partial [Bacteroidetes bacterium]|nr:hypothetical protein [Bacteroidota bacterium]